MSPYRERHVCWYRGFLSERCADCGRRRPWHKFDYPKAYAIGVVAGLVVSALIGAPFALLSMFL